MDYIYIEVETEEKGTCRSERVYCPEMVRSLMQQLLYIEIPAFLMSVII